MMSRGFQEGRPTKFRSIGAPEKVSSHRGTTDTKGLDEHRRKEKRCNFIICSVSIFPSMVEWNFRLIWTDLTGSTKVLIFSFSLV